MSNSMFPMDVSSNRSRLRGAFAGFVKEGGVKSNRPLIDGATGKRIYWLPLTMFPCDSIGGENVSVFAKCVSDSEPITLKDGEAPLVELVNPRAELTDRGLSLVIDGVKRLPEQQKAKS